MERKEEVLEYDSSIEGKMEVVIDVSFYRQTKNLRLTMNKKDGEIIWGYGDMTAELGYVLPKYCAYLDVERFPDIEKFVVENGIGVFTRISSSSVFSEKDKSFNSLPSASLASKIFLF